ncbi:alpha-xenorhabdolysin family binary toxin subunit A [Pseudomonas sp. NPDC087803]|uniref:alpha-xenorhabdolysin family binary toxin subunit A n=1 Tax=Pseudomonas sp. NPDC087803 TaxID=3364448 RepID=UPI003821AEA9
MQSSQNPLVTKDDIRKIKNYISAAKALPRDIEDVEKQLKTKHTGIVGLELFDIVELNHSIINNAQSWTDIEYSMKRVAGSLATFSEDLEGFGQDIIQAIVTMPGYINYLGTLDTLSEEEINSLPPLEIGKNDKQRFGSIQESLAFIARSIEEKKLSSRDVNERLKYFKSELNDKVAIKIGEKLKLAADAQINRQLTALNAAIDLAQQRIDEKTRETNPDFFDHIFGFIVAYTGGGPAWYRHVELEQAIHLRPLIEQRDALAEQVKHKNILAGTLMEFQSGLSSMSIYVEGAILSTSHLETLWISITDYINASQNKVMGMHEFLTLRSFVSSFRVVLKNWKTVQNNSNQLISAFD